MSPQHTFDLLKDLNEQLVAANCRLARAANIAETIEDDRFAFAVEAIEAIGPRVTGLLARLKLAARTVGRLPDAIDFQGTFGEVDGPHGTVCARCGEVIAHGRQAVADDVTAHELVCPSRKPEEATA